MTTLLIMFACVVWVFIGSMTLSSHIAEINRIYGKISWRSCAWELIVWPWVLYRVGKNKNTKETK